jgi:hypothetical protein
LVFLVERTTPLEPEPPVADGNAAYQAVLLTGVRVYQLHSYRVLVARHFGPEVAARVQSRQTAILEHEQPGAGAAMAAAFRLVDSALAAAPPDTASPSHGATERLVARALLAGLPESPDYAPADSETDCPVYKEAGMDTRLAHLLDKAQQELLRAFQPIFRTV